MKTVFETDGRKILNTDGKFPRFFGTAKRIEKIIRNFEEKTESKTGIQTQAVNN